MKLRRKHKTTLAERRQNYEAACLLLYRRVTHPMFKHTRPKR